MFLSFFKKPLAVRDFSKVNDIQILMIIYISAADLHVIEFNGTGVERSTIYPAILPTRVDASSEREIISPSWCIVPMDKYSQHFNIQNTH